jgi:hypothetical protein
MRGRCRIGEQATSMSWYFRGSAISCNICTLAATMLWSGGDAIFELKIFTIISCAPLPENFISLFPL